MPKPIILLLSTILTSCSIGYNYQTANTRVWCQSLCPKPHEVEWFIQRSLFNVDIEGKIDIQFVNEPVPAKTPTGKARGLCWSNVCQNEKVWAKILIVYRSLCLSDSALAHELEHIRLNFFYLNHDSDHLRITSWDKDGIVEFINLEHQVLFCPTW